VIPVAFEDRWRARGDLAVSVARLIEDLAAIEARHGLRTRQRRAGRDAEKFRACVEALLCNVAALHLATPGRRLATARRKFGDGSAIHGKTFIRTLDAMEAGGLIEQSRGAWSDETGRHEISRSLATPALLDYLPASLDPRCLDIAPGPALELRTRKNTAGVSMPVAIPNTSEAKLLAAQVGAVNAYLSRADIKRRDGVVLCLAESNNRLPTITSVHSWSLRRVFNNADTAQGGRLAGGWWLSLRQQERADLILINGEPIAELDFVCMVPRVCYALRDVPWPFGEDRDAPYICGPQAPRAAWKKWVNSMLFATRAMGSWVGKTKGDRLAFAAQFGGLHWREARELVLVRHAALAAAGGFGCELGMAGLRAESDIAVDVVLRLRDQGIPCLPIHDGFAVAVSKTDQAQVAMVQAAQTRLGVPLAVARK
jgi:hypothetical protein